MRYCLTSLFVFLLILAQPAQAESMDDEIDFLLESVATSGCTFIRNGREHDADDARDHLQTKRRRGKRYFDTTEEFVERLASKSSMSGKSYSIRCGDADAVPARDWFMALLNERRSDVSR